MGIADRVDRANIPKFFRSTWYLELFFHMIEAETMWVMRGSNVSMLSEKRQYGATDTLAARAVSDPDFRNRPSISTYCQVDIEMSSIENLHYPQQMWSQPQHHRIFYIFVI